MTRYAVGLPNVGKFAQPKVLVELAVAAEEHGRDGVFVWDHVLYHDREWGVVNPVVVASAIAARTQRIRLGVLMTALPRRRAHVVADPGAAAPRPGLVRRPVAQPAGIPPRRALGRGARDVHRRRPDLVDRGHGLVARGSGGRPGPHRRRPARSCFVIV